MFARFDNSVVMLEAKTLDIAALLKGIVDDIKILAGEKEIEVSFSAQECILITGDEDKLKRLFLNLLDNAIKYTQKNGKVSVFLSKEEGLVRVRVSDTGIGISKEEISHIFERFYQVDKLKSKGGFGLGLSIAKSIAEAHKGKIEVESVLNRGTTFIVSLPL